MSITSLAGTNGVLPFGPPAAPAVPPAAKAGAAGGDANAALGPTSTAADQSNRFLKLLVAQMSNQDPLNPMDSAQVTSQMAQISTVEGVQTLNKTVGGLGAQFTQLQTMQGAALVGHDVATEGNHARVDAVSHRADGGFEIANPASEVSVDIVNPSGQTIGTVKLGAQAAGRHSFGFDVPQAQQGQPLTFKVSAANGSTPIEAKPLSYNAVTAVSAADGKLSLELADGRHVAYDAVAAFL
ncbi:MAG: flagellar hook capping FlgD N-terminal domain-containing protein [Burkholderiaceae bacterium]